ncbi:MAG: hypothetical protein HC897_05470 [Thermoanaerobaculia bacterium]|nr:hypothetical protein [Thermoanaerobaculia bacterium]
MAKAREDLRRVLQGLKMVAQKHKGHIRRLETEKLEKYPGFLSRIHSGRLPILSPSSTRLSRLSAKASKASSACIWASRPIPSGTSKPWPHRSARNRYLPS